MRRISMPIGEIKRRLVEAHRAHDWDLARELSQAKQEARKKPRCIDCGVRVQPGALRCVMHYHLAASLKKLALVVLFAGCQTVAPVQTVHVLLARPVVAFHRYRLEGTILPPAVIPFVSYSTTPSNNAAKPERAE